MRNIILLLLLLTASRLAHAQDYEKIIIPMRLDELQDSIIKKETAAIIQGNTSYTLAKYRTKRQANVIASVYKNGDWTFYTSFATNIRKSKRVVKHNKEVQLPLKDVQLDKIRFMHVKAMLRFNELSLSGINNVMLSSFKGQVFITTIRAYASKDRHRHYLHLTFAAGNKKINLILIILSGSFYNAVLW